MELGKGSHKTVYYGILHHITTAVNSVFDAVTRKAVTEEQEKHMSKRLPEDVLSVSGVGSWAKRGFSSLIGIVSLILKFTGKVVDVTICLSVCRGCEKWKGRENDPEYDVWAEEHKNLYNINHSGSSGLMEVNGIVEMFMRSIEKFAVKYGFYIGDGDSKTLKILLNTAPYGSDFAVKKLECVLHVARKVFKRANEARKALIQKKKALKQAEEKAAAKTPAKKIVASKVAAKKKAVAQNPFVKTQGLTIKLMKELSENYGLAVRRNSDSVENMRKEIWAGHPQVIKVVQSTPNKTLSSIVGTTNIESLKVFKTPGQESRVLPSGTQVLRTISLQSPSTPGQRLVTIPLQNAKVSSVKPGDSVMTKTIQLTSAQMSDIKQAIASQQHQQTSNQQVVKDPSGKTFISPILDHSGARKRHDIDSGDYVPDKRRKTEKVGKGLRHFSMKVCEKVKKKGTTSYNEVADELVGEFTNPAHVNSLTDQQYDQKNIRRRVYDALNVLMAMNIISKEKKEIRWLGLPTNSLQECMSLEKDKKKKIERIKAKTQQLHQLILQHISFKNLVERNRVHQHLNGPPKPNSAIQLPFIIVNTSKKTVIDCCINDEKTEYLFNFNDKFEIHDDIEVLKRMGLAFGLDKGECSSEDLQSAKSMVPKSLEKYVEQMACGDLDQFIPVTIPGPSTSMDDLEIKLEGASRPPSSSQTSLSEDPLSPPSHYYSEEEDEEDESEQDEQADSDLEVN